jgi:hypothetical protein
MYVNPRMKILSSNSRARINLQVMNLGTMWRFPFTPRSFYSREKVPTTTLRIWDWVGPWALVTMWRRPKRIPRRYIKPSFDGHPAKSVGIILTELSWILSFCIIRVLIKLLLSADVLVDKRMSLNRVKNDYHIIIITKNHENLCSIACS